MVAALKPRKKLPTMMIPQLRVKRNWRFALTVIVVYGSSAACAVSVWYWVLK